MMWLDWPWALAGLLVLPVFWLLARQSAAPPGPRLPRLLLRCGVYLMLVAALSDPRWPAPSTRTHFAWLVDTSASANATASAIEFARACGLPPGSQSWFAFAGEPAVASPGQLVAPMPERTRAAEAALFAAAQFPPGASRVLTVFTDGVAPGGGLAAAAASLRAAGVQVFVVPTPRSPLPEAGVHSVSAPSQVRPGEPFEVRARIVSNRAARMLVTVSQDGLRAGERIVDVQPGAQEVVFETASGEGRTVHIAASVFPAEDTLPQNNTEEIAVPVAGPTRVLVISDGGLSALAAALEAQGMALDERPPEGVPTDPAGLREFDAVVLDAVPAERLGASRNAALAAFVRETGGGLVALGGPDAFDAGGYGGTPLGGMLPVQSKAEKQADTPSLALALVLDKSGSMQGEKLDMAKSAALAAADVLSPSDVVGVVAFDGAASWLARLQRPDPGLAAKLGAVAAGGGTNIAAGLALALDGLRKAPAGLRHAIVLTDGVSTPGPYLEIAEQMRAEGITLSAVGLGADVDAGVLAEIARLGGGRFYFSDSPAAIPQIFLRETYLAARSGLAEEPFRAVPVRVAPFLDGIGFDAAPPLLGRVRVELRSGASLWLAASDAEPLLVSWRAGLGHVAAFTSDAGPRWASEWLGWPDFGAFWAQTLREVMRPQSLRTLPARLELIEGRLWIQVDAMDAGVPPDLSAKAVAGLPDGRTAELELTPSAPGRLDGWLPDPGFGAVWAAVSVRSNGRPWGEAHARASLRPPDDGVLEDADFTALAALAADTGGKLDPTPAEILAAAPPPQSADHKLWPWFAWAALALFLPDLLLRRIPGARIPTR